MRIERAGRWPAVPWWAALVVAVHLALVGLCVLAARERGAQVPCLCMFRRLTGWPCPTCGTTRMVLALGRGEWLGAAACNPLVFIGAVLGGVLLVLRVAFGRRVVCGTSAGVRRALVTLAIVAALANWVYLVAAP